MIKLLRDVGFYELKVFMLLAKDLNMTLAARKLNIDEAALNEIVDKLEQILGIQLFYHTRDVIALTLSGKDFSQKVPAIFMALEQACVSAKQVYAGEAGKLTIAFTAAVEFDLLPHYVSVFSKECPLADPRLIKMNSLDQVRALLSRKIHLGILSLPSEIAGFSFRVVRSDKLLFALPANHNLATESSTMRIQDAANENFLMLGRQVDENYYDMLQQFFDNEAICPRVIARYDSLAALLAAVANGEGIALITKSKQQINKAIVYRDLNSNNAALNTVLAWNSDIESPLLQHFLSIVG